MRNYNEMKMLNHIEYVEQYVPVVNRVVLTEVDKIGIQSYRNRCERNRSKRVPIFDRTKVSSTLGYMVEVAQVREQTRFAGFSQMIAAELQKAGM